MTLVQQYYGGTGVPMSVPSLPYEVVGAWRSHRPRLRAWLGTLDEETWSAPTRCSEWDVAALVRHLASGSQFLGYTLHEARKGKPTRLLEGFDPQRTPGAAAGMFLGLSPEELLVQLEEMDGRVEAELDRFAADGWHAPAEAPLGQVPSYVTLNHFLFDSWVHEYDLMLPAGQTPVTVPEEALVTASYVLALSGVAHAVGHGPARSLALHVHLTDLDRHLAVEVGEDQVIVAHSGSNGGADLRANALDLVDFATGRTGALGAGDDASAFLRGLATVMG